MPNFKVLQAQKVAALKKMKAAVAAAGPIHVVGQRTGCARATSAVWSPDGQQIAWAGSAAICVANADGSEAHPLPRTRGVFWPMTELAWIKPGLILYDSDYAIGRVQLGGKPQQSFKPASAPSFAVSAKGSLFSTATPSDCPSCTGPGHVWTLGGQLVGAIGNNGDYHDPPSLSPDDTRVAYGQNRGIWTANTDGSDAHQLVSQGVNPLWSPNGAEIAYVATGSATSPGNLRVVGANGGPSRLLGQNLTDDGGWSPDGKLIASWNISGLVVVNVATGNQRKLPYVGIPSAYPYPSTNSWSPNSKNLLVTARISARCFALWRVPVNGSKPQLLSSCF